MAKSSLLPATAAALACVILCGCASQPVRAKDPRDPWERMNRATWNFDYGFYEKVAVPVSRFYIRHVPQPVRHGVSNFVSNFQYPVVIVNDLLQAKFKTTASDTGRFLLNSTLGLAGILDPGTAAGLAKHDNDLGVTFGVWGIHPGPYFVLPFLGPSDVRDTVGRVADSYYISPQYYLSLPYELGFDALYAFDLGANTLVPQLDLLQQQNIFDKYAFVRNAYLQQRDYMVHGTSIKSQEQQEEELEKSLQDTGDTGAETSTPPAAPASGAKPPAVTGPGSSSAPVVPPPKAPEGNGPKP